MVKFQEIKVGDYLIADNDGDKKQGEVTNLNNDEKQVCINTGTQDFWYEVDQLSSIPLDDSQLANFKFHSEENEDGSVKYMKGAFRMLIPAKNDFSKFEIWYREEKRQIMEPLKVHQFQNHYHDMTKVHLNDVSFD